MNAILLAPTPLTKDNLNVAIDAGHITKEAAAKAQWLAWSAASNRIWGRDILRVSRLRLFALFSDILRSARAGTAG